MSIRSRKSKRNPEKVTYQVYFKYTDASSKEKRYFSKSGFLTLEDAQLYENKKKEEISQQYKYLKRFKMTLNEVFKEWIEVDAIYQYQYNTVNDYKNRFLKHIQPRLGDLKMSDLDYRTLQVFFNENAQMGLSTNKKLKEVLSTIINFAMKCNYMSDNPLTYVHVRGVDTTRKSSSTICKDDDFTKVIAYLAQKKTHINNAYILALYIGRYTGLRISEVFALDREDFDFNNEVIHIHKKLVYANLKKEELYVVDQLKSKRSKGLVPFHKNLRMIVSKWLEYHPHEHVLSDKKGNYLNPKQLEFALWKASKELNVNLHYHMLRHTLASKLVNNGADLKSTQQIMRHANITTTLNIYTHVDEKQKLNALNKAFLDIDI